MEKSSSDVCDMHKFTNMPKNRHNYKQRRPSMARTESTLINSHSTRRYSYGRCAAECRDPCNRCIIINPGTAKHPHSHRHAQKQANTTNARVAFLSSILLEFPLPVIKWTHLPSLQPPGDAMKVEGVIAHTPRNRALLTRR